MDKIEQAGAIQLLEQSGQEFISLYQQGRLTVEIYKPNVSDRQSPHDRDEFYLIISGKGMFRLLNEVTSFQPGDFLFVPAGAAHRFLDFTDDFITWVFFIS